MKSLRGGSCSVALAMVFGAAPAWAQRKITIGVSMQGLKAPYVRVREQAPGSHVAAQYPG